MRQELRINHVYVPATATYAQVLSLYSDRVIDKKLHIFQKSISEVKYPIHPAKVLQQSELETDGVMKLLQSFPVKKLSQYIQDPLLNLTQVKSIIHILAALVRISPTKVGDATLPPALSAVMPTLLVEIANESRVHSGLRLVKRAVCNSMNPNGPDVMDATMKVCELRETGVMVLVLDYKVKASMRNVVYNTQVANSSKDLIACGCSCKCGAENEQRILDVHPLSLLYELVLLLFEGLAQHVLVELRQRLQSDEPLLLDSTEGVFYDDLRAICSVAGSTSVTNPKATVGDLLHGYTVGTDQSKRIKGRANAKDLGLIRQKKYRQPVKIKLVYFTSFIFITLF